MEKLNADGKSRDSVGEMFRKWKIEYPKPTMRTRLRRLSNRVRRAAWEVIYAYQRVFHRLDNTDYYDLGYFVSSSSIKILKFYMERVEESAYPPYSCMSPHASPLEELTSEYSEKDWDDARVVWKNKLQKMIDGFMALEMIDDKCLTIHDEDFHAYKKLFDEALDLFKEHVFDLND